MRRVRRLAWLIVCGLLLVSGAVTIAGTFQATISGEFASAGAGGAQADAPVIIGVPPAGDVPWELLIVAWALLGAALLSRGARKRPLLDEVIDNGI